MVIGTKIVVTRNREAAWADITHMLPGLISRQTAILELCDQELHVDDFRVRIDDIVGESCSESGRAALWSLLLEKDSWDTAVNEYAKDFKRRNPGAEPPAL